MRTDSWLDSSAPLASGACPQAVRDRLAELSSEPVRLMRGYHYCQFCQAIAEPPKLLRSEIRLYEASDVAHGNGEIWIADHDGTNFAAPCLIVHYIDEHHYLPPAPFIEAVRFGTPTPGLDQKGTYLGANSARVPQPQASVDRSRRLTVRSCGCVRR
jgi:hypothetical protein